MQFDLMNVNEYICTLRHSAMNIWNTICKDILEKKRKQATEKEYQELVYTHFRYLLGWHCERVENQYQLRVGSSVNYVYPDIVFFKNDKPLFVIEMKKPNHIQNKEEIVQLFSYMKLLPVQFGIYIGEHIELFYYEYGKEPASVLKIDFVENSEIGKKFIELFKQDNFNTEALTDFCNIQIAKQEKQKEIDKLINELTTEKGRQLIFELLDHKLQNEGYGSENIEKIKNEIEINIFRKNKAENTHIEQHIPATASAIYRKGKKDYTHYMLNGQGNYGKGRLALAIVKLFIERNPHLTFYEIKNRVPFGIEKISEIQKWKETADDINKDNRWRESEEDLMISADGFTFAFTREIGSGNIGKIIDFAIEQGYTVEPIK